MTVYYIPYMHVTDPIVPPPESTFEKDGQSFIKIFVYGILKSTETNMMAYDGGVQIDKGYLTGYAMYDDGVAIVVKGDASDKSYGEVWEVPREVIERRIDMIEAGYTRTWIPDQFGGVWVYLSIPLCGKPKITEWSRIKHHPFF